MSQGLVRFVRNLLIALGVAVAATLAINAAWNALGGADLTVHGWIALVLCISGTIGLAWGLMALAFKSSREGWDDRVDNSLDPAGPAHREHDDEP